MFNKLKNVSAKWGNKKQRKKYNEEAIDELKMAIEITKLELSKGRTVRPYIKSVTDDQKFPTYIGRQAMWMTTEMNEFEQKEKMKFLENNKIKTNLTSEGKVISFEDIQEEK